MKKALLPLMIASLVPAAAFADVTVYGKAFVTWQSTDLQTGQNYTELVNNASRIGLKGSESVNEDIKVIYQFEYQTKVDDGSIANNYTCAATSTTTTPTATTKTTCTATGGQTFSQRNIFVGVQGNFGVAKLGMFDTPLKLAQEKIDLFNDLIGDMQAVVQGETRAKNVVQYSTPEFTHITGNFAYINSEADVDGLVGGKSASTENGYSASIVYNTKTVYLALANDHNVTNAMNKTLVASGLDTDILRAVGRFVVGPVVLGALYETYDNGVIDENGYLVSAKWEIDPKWALKAQAGKSDMITLGGQTTSLGVDYKLSKNATLLAYYTHNEDDVVDKTKQRDDNYIGAGIEFNF
ncbi:MAG: porin [Moraxellaceae bacterium]|nr:MAG: porin [Moraxellaceae bacterium]